jgi:hypothetical protein
MMKLEIVCHCWERAFDLASQLMSLERNPPRELDLVMTVFYSEEDSATIAMLERYGQSARKWPLPTEQLCRRTIGRNMAALATTADWVWFIDCDYIFGEGTLDALATVLPTVDADLVYPCVVGARAITKAIGGAQIVRGDVARRDGYCRDVPELHTPLQQWIHETPEDVRFRELLGTDGTPIYIPNLGRLTPAAREVQSSDWRQFADEDRKANGKIKTLCQFEDGVCTQCGYPPSRLELQNAIQRRQCRPGVPPRERSIRPAGKSVPKPTTQATGTPTPCGGCGGKVVATKRGPSKRQPVKLQPINRLTLNDVLRLPQDEQAKLFCTPDNDANCTWCGVYIGNSDRFCKKFVQL